VVSEKNVNVKSRDDDARVCMLSNDGMHYSIYALSDGQTTAKDDRVDITMSQ
jgi:hypothetical protein